jgi:hypothetical protein
MTYWDKPDKSPMDQLFDGGCKFLYPFIADLGRGFDLWSLGRRQLVLFPMALQYPNNILIQYVAPPGKICRRSVVCPWKTESRCAIFFRTVQALWSITNSNYWWNIVQDVDSSDLRVFTTTMPVPTFLHPARLVCSPTVSSCISNSR